MYQPKIAEDAIPPRNYPPEFTRRKLFLYILFTVILIIVGYGLNVKIHRPFIPFCLLSLSGYVITSCVTLERSNLKSRFGNHNELIKLALSLPILYFIAPEITLQRSFTLDCWLVYVSSFSFGLQMTYIDNITTLQTLGSKFPVPKLWRTITAVEGILLILTLTFFFVIALGLMVDIHKQGMVYRTAAVYSLMIFAVLIYRIISVCFGRTGIHMHHYIIMGLFPLCMTACVGWHAWVAQGMFLGVFVEGIAVWGMDPMFW